jgi:hypothetical protein
MYSAKRTRIGYAQTCTYPVDYARLVTFWIFFKFGFVFSEREDIDLVFSLARLGVSAIIVLFGDSFRCRR